MPRCDADNYVVQLGSAQGVNGIAVQSQYLYSETGLASCDYAVISAGGLKVEYMSLWKPR